MIRMWQRRLVTLLFSVCLLHDNVARNLQPSQKLHKVRSLNNLNDHSDCPSVECPVLECPEIDQPAQVYESRKLQETQDLHSPRVDCSACPVETVKNSECPELQTSNQLKNPSELRASLGESAFTVELSADRSLSDAVPITFDDVLADPGDSFIPLLGTFICPDDDTYAFYWTIQAVTGRIAAMLVKDGVDMKYGPLTSEIPGESGGSSSMATIMRCTSGSHVWLRAVAWPDNTACNIIQKEYSSFTAFKLFRQGEEDASGFTAQISTNTTSSGTLVFNEELIDLGNDCNPSTGEFIVPETGIYIFTISAHLTTSSTDGANLQMNESFQWYIAALRNTYETSQDSGTSTITRILECKKNDVITVTGGSDTFMAGVTSFTGYRLLNPENQDDIVAFHASLTGNTNVINDMTIPFDVDRVNVGDYYFPAFAIFVCPDNATYFFNWAITIRGEADNRLGEGKLMMSDQIKKIGPQTSRVLYSSSGWSSTSSAQCIIQCVEDKALAVKAVISNSNPASIYRDHSNFVGFRLPPI